MIDSNILKTQKDFSLNVSRETLIELDSYEKEIISKNRDINLISKNTKKNKTRKNFNRYLITIIVVYY